ncbi:MAG TPA: thiamine phosphate synthase [Patescibacteria group bacterium]|nr:thiamine phosphate synthase [Patescibacteria group bacterium]
MKPLSECRLYAFVDTAYLQGRSPEFIAQELCDGGADLIQVRAKGTPLEEARRLVRTVQVITQRSNVGLVVNDHLDVARQLGADFCHLGQEDFFGAGFERVEQLNAAGSGVRIGLSTHGPMEAQRAIDARADYIAIGPVYATATKPTAKPVTLDYVRWAAAHSTVPWFAIGGITLDNLDQVIAAGARRICVVSAILNAADIAARCREFKARICRV